VDADWGVDNDLSPNADLSLSYICIYVCLFLYKNNYETRHKLHIKLAMLAHFKGTLHKNEVLQLDGFMYLQRTWDSCKQ
jgi:hypothetical protein